MNYKTTPEGIGQEIRELNKDIARLQNTMSQAPSMDCDKALQIATNLRTVLENAEQLTVLLAYHLKRMEA